MTIDMDYGRHNKCSTVLFSLSQAISLSFSWSSSQHPRILLTHVTSNVLSCRKSLLSSTWLHSLSGGTQVNACDIYTLSLYVNSKQSCELMLGTGKLSQTNNWRKELPSARVKRESWSKSVVLQKTSVFCLRLLSIGLLSARGTLVFVDELHIVECESVKFKEWMRCGYSLRTFNEVIWQFTKL